VKLPVHFKVASTAAHGDWHYMIVKVSRLDLISSTVCLADRWPFLAGFIQKSRFAC
jgi:hypothetical protein